ncbi:Fc.00g081630.m01.CDS01 [Cosmosporella sp. VM-42]
MASSEEAGLGSLKDVLSNMSPESRKDAYNKILVALGPVFVFQESASRPIEFFVPGKPTQWPALALEKCREYNEQETNAVFYGSNHFHLVDTTTRRETSILQAFLVSLTSTHARLLSHISLSFPALEAVQGQPQTLGVQQDGMRSLKLLQDYCNNLQILELYVHKGNAFGLVEDTPINLQSLTEALSQVDAQLKVVSSLKRIVIRYYHDRPTPGVMHLMQGLGWIVLMGDKEVP